MRSVIAVSTPWGNGKNASDASTLPRLSSAALSHAIFTLLDAQPMVRDDARGSGAALEPTVEFDRVSFAYPGGRRAEPARPISTWALSRAP